MLKEHLCLRFVRFGGVAWQRWPDDPFTQTEIRIGRPDSKRPGDGPDLSLEPDHWASRRHARVYIEENKWFIEDLGSKHGTLVDGQEIKDQGPVELIPDTPVKTGKTTWTIIPADWLFIRQNDVIIYAPCTTTINYSLYHCGIPIIGTLTARNLGEQNSIPLHLRLWVIDYSDPCEIEIPQLDSGSKLSLGVPTIPLHVDILRRQVEPVRTRLQVEVDRRRYPEAEKDITVLGFWDWSHERAARKTIAAFVSPQNPVIECIVLEAQENLKGTAGTDSFSELLRSGKEDAEGIVLETLYQCLKEHWHIHYECPQLKLCPGETETYQTIRPPHHIFPRYRSNPEGRATCLDLSLLMAGCLEHIGLCPLVIFTGDNDGIPRHAFAGCWAGLTPGSRPMIYEAEFLYSEVKSKHLFVMECTVLAEDQNEKLSFDQGVESAVKQLRDAKWVCAVDIAALRPPNGSITPMDSPLEPEVARAYNHAKQFAKSKRREAIETTHLFYGLLAANGEVIRWVFREAGFDVEEKSRKIKDSIRMHNASKEPIPTWNYLQCQRLAEEYAWQSGAHSVREQDLLWALLDKSKESPKLKEICHQIGVDLERLASLLNQRYPCPSILLTSLSFPS